MRRICKLNYSMEAVMSAPVLTAQDSVRKNGLNIFRRSAVRPALGAAVLALMLAGCAKQSAPGYYNTEHDSTLSDARQQAQGRNAARAPSQIQLGFGDTEQKKKPADEAAPAEAAATSAMPAVRPLLEAKTFLGTVPCLTGEAACSAARVTLTLAPSGEWRSRTQILGAAGQQKPVLEQGCWSLTGMDPWRILLKSPNTPRTASLSFLNDNVLRINAINDNKPALDYHLTRQADVDGIDEMGKRAALKCGADQG